ncbi:hypothetical protein ACU686_12825 [Yinghuangia aomiensis]
MARTALASAPQLVPVYSHRYLPGAAGTWGHLVLSVYQTDIIYYGNDLADYIHREFTGRPSPGPDAHATVAFWSYIVEGGTERAPTTPHDPYATTAQEAVEYLRMLALERLIGRQVDDDQLIQAGLVASVLDVEAPRCRGSQPSRNASTVGRRHSSIRSCPSWTSCPACLPTTPTSRGSPPAGSSCAGGCG